MKTKSAIPATALYMRLSKDDEGTGESSSITTQRSLLTAYAKERGYKIVCEYVDDGYSGTNFDRPAFQRMIQDIEERKINLVLTKDLSRLGRDYIQTGQYTEVYFPSKKVRYIAVNDGFDSESQHTEIAPFRHVVNEMYARDASQKIRSALLMKMKNGSYIGNFAPYGYQKDPKDKNHLVPDEASAAVVQKIFSLAAEGTKPADIAHYLNSRNIPTPLLYRCSLHPQLHPGGESKHKQWTAAAVSKLLRNPVYLGHMAQGKTTKVSFKSKITLNNPQADWIVVTHTHKPLVDEDVFALAQKRMESRICEKRGRFHNIFSGIARCADCGKAMSTVGTRRKDSPANLACGGYKLYGGQECSNHFIDYRVLYQIVLETVRERLRLLPEERQDLFQKLCSQLQAQPDRESHKNELRRLQAEEEKQTRIFEQLYEDNANGRISEEHFYRLLQKCEQKSQELKNRIRELSALGISSRRTEKAANAFQRLSKLCDLYQEIPELNASLLFACMDRIEVCQGRYEKTDHGRVKHQEIKIYFRFQTQGQAKEIAIL